MNSSRQRRIKKILAGITAAVIAAVTFLMAPCTAGARSQIDLNRKGRLILAYKYDSQPIVGAQAQIYRVAEVNMAGEFTLLAPYRSVVESKNANLNSMTAQQWKDLVYPISAYIYTNKIPASATAVSGQDGTAEMAGLDLGIYLVTTNALDVKAEDCTYTFSSFFTAVPELDDTTGDWRTDTGDSYYTSYDVISQVKCEKTVHPKETRYEIHKNWIDYNSKRPVSINVNIYLDGTLYKEVVLDSSNNWSYKWSYAQGHVFTVAEKVPTGYKVTYTNNGAIFTMTNTGTPDKPSTPPGTPDKPSNPPGTPDNPPETPQGPVGEVLGAARRLLLGEDESPEVLGARRLPQTGQLWWPVFVLAAGGMALIFAGAMSERRSHEG